MKIKFLLKAAKAIALAAVLLSTSSVLKAQNSTEIFTVVESAPEFPGGMAAFDKYLGSNIRYPDVDRKNNVQGRVIVSFVVEKNGSLSDLKVIRQPSETLGSEAVRVLDASPKWKPGYQNGMAVRTQFTVPISFTLPGLDTNKDQTPSNALYVLDGKETTKDEVKKVSTANIAFINVIKGPEAIKKYGEKAKDGVVEITTKK